MTRQNKHLDKITVLQIFTPDECADIIKNAVNSWTEEEGMIGKEKEVSDQRNVTLFSPPPETVMHSVWFQKIINTISNTIVSFNNDKDGYGFDIIGMAETPYVMRYMAPDINPNKKAGKYDWHMDVGVSSIPSMRKLSYSIFLNVGEYEGGELEFHVGPDTESPSQTLGSMVLFPSYLIHRVPPITKGIRYAIVGWMHGDSFR